MTTTLEDAAAALAAGRTSSSELVERALARIADPSGEGGRVFLRVYAEAARASAAAMDALRRVGRAPGRYAGIPVSLKDLLDVEGEVTSAGSVILADAPPAAAHAPVVARLLAAGMIPVGRTNMTEFAFSGLGLNPHFGTPRAPWDRANGRIPGGSSSGAAVSVADGMALAAVGTDTGGSCRIPAAFCGVVGFKPTARRVPRDGVLPLSPTLDSVGPLARSVACCAVMDSVLAGGAPLLAVPESVAGLRIAVPDEPFLLGLDPVVEATLDRAVARLHDRGAAIDHRRFASIDRMGPAHAAGGFAAADALAWHRKLLARGRDQYDPRVANRILAAGSMSAAEYAALVFARAEIIAAFEAEAAPYDVLLAPTVPVLPPSIASLADEAAYWRMNGLTLRNPSVVNFLDGCSISLPIHPPGAPPVGLMLFAPAMQDARLLAIAAAVEAALVGGV